MQTKTNYIQCRHNLCGCNIYNTALVVEMISPFFNQENIAFGNVFILNVCNNGHLSMPNKREAALIFVNGLQCFDLPLD